MILPTKSDDPPTALLACIADAKPCGPLFKLQRRHLVLGVIPLILVAACLFSRVGLFLACARWCLPPATLEVPVVGLARSKIVSNWDAPRSGGRRHRGVDLFARRGTRVVSATRGRVWKV